MMNPGIIEASLNLTSVVGIALVQDTHLPYLCIKDTLLSRRQKQAIVSLISNVVESIPDTLSAFEFQVMDYYAYAHQLNAQATFVILAQQQDLQIKLTIAHHLRAATENSLERFVAFFKAIEAQKEPLLRQEKRELAVKTHPENLECASSVGAFVENLNQLSQIVCQYLGPQITAAHWNTSKPDYEWLEDFNVDTQAEISFMGSPQTQMRAVHHLCIRQWTNAFMKQCSEIIQDLPQKVQQASDSTGRTLSIVPVGNLMKLAQFNQHETGLFWD